MNRVVWLWRPYCFGLQKNGVVETVKFFDTLKNIEICC